MKVRLLLFFSVLALAFFLADCAPKEKPKAISEEDNPNHHYVRGMIALEKKDTDTAIEKFNRAIYLDSKFSRAYSGLAIAYALRAVGQQDPAFKNVEGGRAYDNLNRASKSADKPEEKFDHYLAVIRVNTLLKPKNWLEKAEDAYKDATKLKVDESKLDYYQGTESAHYFMGLAYLDALEFQKARDMFGKVLSAKREGKWHEPSDKAWKRLDKIVRAMGGITVGDVGKKIAMKEQITRGDLAALLVDELKIDKILAGRIPVKSEIEKMKPEFVPADVLNHPFKEEVLTILKWKVRGLEPVYDETTKAYLFKPEQALKRGEMAFILEDVLIKLTGDEKIATAYFGHEKSPFPDVRPTSPFYNAVMNMTTRGIMEPEISGEFRINDPVDGPEALLAIRVLKQRTNIY